jgi:ubiquinone/menaquinone biosynthesis C-methylase UbiE
MNTAEYERMYSLEDSYWWFVGRHRFVESLLARRRKASAGRPLDILDIGCGTGAMSECLKRWGRVVSADFSPLALQFSRRRGLQSLVVADAMRLPLRSERFDVAVAMDVLEHLEDDCVALTELQRVLKPGGLLIVTVPAYRHLWSEHDIALMHCRRYVRRELRERLVAAGFKIDKLAHTMTLLYPVVAIQRRLNARKPPKDKPEASLPPVSAAVNSTLIGLLAIENSVASRIDLPFGLTIAAVATRPA